MREHNKINFPYLILVVYWWGIKITRSRIRLFLENKEQNTFAYEKRISNPQESLNSQGERGLEFIRK